MANEGTNIFSLDGTLQKGDLVWDGNGKLVVVDKNQHIGYREPMPFAGRWFKDDREGYRSLGFSSAQSAWEVVHAAIALSFVPNNLEIGMILTCRSDEELKEYLSKSGILFSHNW